MKVCEKCNRKNFDTHQICEYCGNHFYIIGKNESKVKHKMTTEFSAVGHIEYYNILIIQKEEVKKILKNLDLIWPIKIDDVINLLEEHVNLNGIDSIDIGIKLDEQCFILDEFFIGTGIDSKDIDCEFIYNDNIQEKSFYELLKRQIYDSINYDIESFIAIIEVNYVYKCWIGCDIKHFNLINDNDIKLDSFDETRQTGSLYFENQKYHLDHDCNGGHTICKAFELHELKLDDFIIELY